MGCGDCRTVQVVKFTDGLTRHETWELPDNGWDDWATVTDRFLGHAIAGIAAEYVGDSVEWLEINGWPISGRLIVFPSQDGPFGNRGERVCFELSSKHLEAAFCRIGEVVPDADRDAAWTTLSRNIWNRVSECLISGKASQEFAIARQSHRLLIAGFDYEAGEKLCWLKKDGALRRGPGSIDAA
jgi:hypothetical protein